MDKRRSSFNVFHSSSWRPNLNKRIENQERKWQNNPKRQIELTLNRRKEKFSPSPHIPVSLPFQHHVHFLSWRAELEKKSKEGKKTKNRNAWCSRLIIQFHWLIYLGNEIGKKRERKKNRRREKTKKITSSFILWTVERDEEPNALKVEKQSKKDDIHRLTLVPNSFINRMGGSNKQRV